MAPASAPVEVKKDRKPTITMTLSDEVYRYVKGAAAEDRRTPAMWATIYFEESVSDLIEDAPLTTSTKPGA